MNFSQAWDAGFRSVLIFAGMVFAWLGLVEPLFASRDLSVLLMLLAAVAAAAIFFALAWRRCSHERRRADADIAALLSGDGS
ncbi:MAG: hypothetical protein ACKOED_01460 [Aestuariivirga sp.]|uniref:hypothetical protein n=1 Tax=Aestuariivirga sp. TaxID=2650926 RepID=UPI0038D17449